MAGKSHSKYDFFEREIEQALNPGKFIRYDDSFSFVNSLDIIVEKITALIKSEPARAVILFETFIAGCYEKAEEIDDSSGSFGQFVDDLFCGWIKARQAANADPDDTATRLLARMDNDPYCFC